VTGPPLVIVERIECAGSWPQLCAKGLKAKSDSSEINTLTDW